MKGPVEHLCSWNISGDDCSVRGGNQQQCEMLSYVLSLRTGFRKSIRSIWMSADQILWEIGKAFDGLCAKTGRSRDLQRGMKTPPAVWSLGWITNEKSALIR